LEDTPTSNNRIAHRLTPVKRFLDAGIVKKEAPEGRQNIKRKKRKEEERKERKERGRRKEEESVREIGKI
jgi:hypothetical protein